MNLLKPAAFVIGLIGLLWFCSMMINAPGFDSDTSLKHDSAQ